MNGIFITILKRLLNYVAVCNLERCLVDWGAERLSSRKEIQTRFKICEEKEYVE